MWRTVLVAMVAAGCSPLDGFPIEKHSGEPAVVLPFRCERVERSPGGTWICKQRDHVVTLEREFPGKDFALAGSALWTFDPLLERFEEDPMSGKFFRSTDAGFDWNENARIPSSMRAFVAREQEFVLSARSLSLVSVDDGGFTERSSVLPPFSQSSGHFPNAGEQLLDDGDFIWAYGPGSAGALFCPLRYSSDAGVQNGPACVSAPAIVTGIANGGFWMNSDGVTPVRFFRPAGAKIDVVPGIQLPANLKWERGGIPWVIDPDPTTVRIPRVDGTRVVIDEYANTSGFVWTGANERWVFESPSDGSPTTRVYAR